MPRFNIYGPDDGPLIATIDAYDPEDAINEMAQYLRVELETEATVPADEADDEPTAWEVEHSRQVVDDFLTASARADLEAIQERASMADDEDLKYFGEHE